MRIDLSDPVTVALSPPGEQRWSFTQFPALSRLPSGRILLMYADAPDASESHGEPGVAFISADDGETWQSYAGEPVATRPHFAVTPLPDGAALIVPSGRYYDCVDAGWSLPAPASTAHVYGTLYTHRCDELPAEVQDYFRHLPAPRYDPATGAWHDDVVDYDMRDRLAWGREGSTLLPRPFFERAAHVHGGEVMFAATGVTSGAMLRGVRRFRGGASTHSLVMRSKSGTVRYIEASHNFDQKTGFDPVDG